MTKQEMQLYAQKSQLTAFDIIHDYKALCIRTYNLADDMQIPLSRFGASQINTGYPTLTTEQLESLLKEIDEYIQP